ncbi:MAG TPA: protein kinase [Ktedonobacteraceae bacterium]|nr:protein kinase [Ktedonobacteraceae bacterium]
MSSTASRHVGKYVLRECIKRGSAFEIWEGYDEQRRMPVLIKFLLLEGEGDGMSIPRFQQEVKPLLALHHANIASLLDARMRPASTPRLAKVYLVTDYVEGQTLAEYMQGLPHTGRLTVENVRILAGIGMAIDYAHQHGVVHGDLQPAHILLRHLSQERGQGDPVEPVVINFGLNNLLEGVTGAPPRRSVQDMLYIAPEQARGLPASVQSDLYAFGVLLYELCTGVVPFQGSRPVAVLMQHANAAPPLPSLINPNIPPALNDVILRSLDKDPTQRFATATALTLAVAKACKIPLPERFNYQVYALDAMEAARNGTEQERPVQSFVEQTTTSTRHPSQTLRKPRLVHEKKLVPVPPAQLIQPPPQPDVPHRVSWRVRLAITFIVLCALLVVGLGSTMLRPQAPAVPQPVGSAFFMNSGQLNEHISDQGVNDELQIDLSGVPQPDHGNAYYAWLLPDRSNAEAPPVFVGKMTVRDGKIHFIYSGTQSHANLLAVTSRFLITEESALNVPDLPSTDTAAWRYYGEIAQTPNAADQEHNSLLDHFRHLLVESPELQQVNLHGGLAIWLLQNAQKVFTLATAARDAWQHGDMQTVKQNDILLIDYLNGKELAAKDLPAGTPFLADENETRIPLLGRDPKEPVGENGSTIPVGYVHLIGLHLAGAVSSPSVTSEQQKQAAQANHALDDMTRALERVYTQAAALAKQSDQALAQHTTLTTLNDIVAAAQEAYTGQLNQTSGQSQGGAIGIYHAIQNLVHFTVMSYSQANERQGDLAAFVAARDPGISHRT